MKRRLLLILFLFATISNFAQNHWISYPDADDSSQVWFRRAFISSRVEKAWLNVATTGLVKIYVNGMNVSTAVFEPIRETKDAEPVAMNIDISNYIRPDTNVIALWYSPIQKETVKPQVAVEFYGTRSNEQHFSFTSDGSWLCRKAPVEINSRGGEDIDGTKDFTEWKNDGLDLALWQTSEDTLGSAIFKAYHEGSAHEAYKITHIRSPKFFDVQGDSTIYDFGTAFIGWVRVTLRGTRKGEEINFGPMKYICNGKIDEQACQKFMINSYRRMIVFGDKNFRREQISKVEGIEICPQLIMPY